MKERINKFAKTKRNIIHPDVNGEKVKIGGKIILLDFEVSHHEIDQHQNYASINFAIRRPDFDYNFHFKTYYGHIDELGYIVAEDEIKELSKIDVFKLKTYFKKRYALNLTKNMLYRKEIK